MCGRDDTGIFRWCDSVWREYTSLSMKHGWEKLPDGSHRQVKRSRDEEKRLLDLNDNHKRHIHVNARILNRGKGVVIH